MAIIETRDLTKDFGSDEVRVTALREITLTIEQGEFVAITGPSGSGKSTLLSILGGIEVPTSGQILLEGVDLATLSDDDRTIIRRRRLGFIFQSFNLLPMLTAAENISLPMELDGISSAAAAERTKYVLEMVEMDHRRDHLPSQMSGGEQQRIAVARALAIKPALLLADEPTGNLDSRQSARITRLLEDLVVKSGQTIVMVTHDMEIAAAAYRNIGLRDGALDHDNVRYHHTNNSAHTHSGGATVEAK